MDIGFDFQGIVCEGKMDGAVGSLILRPFLAGCYWDLGGSRIEN